MPPVVTLILQVPERELSESQRLLPREGSTMVDKRSGMWTVEGIRGTAHRWALCKSSILSVFFLPPSLTSPPFLFFPLSFYKNRISIGIWDCCALAFAILLPQYLFFFPSSISWVLGLLIEEPFMTTAFLLWFQWSLMSKHRKSDFDVIKTSIRS